jgi:predicted dehydrogenase
VGHRVTDSRVFRQRGAFAYLDDEDRYLSAQTSPDFKFGVIGCGMMGREHMRNTLLVGGASIGGIFDPTPKSIDHALKMLAKLQPSELPKTYGSLEEACADPDTDALIIATPNYTHLEVMRVATKTNKAIFLEKPIATSVTDAIEVCRLAANHRNIVRVGLQYRHKAVYAEAITEVLEQRNIGEVCSVNMLEHRFPFLDKVGQWNKFDEYTGGALVEKCCHYFDLINLFAGGIPEQVFASGSQAVNFKDFTHDNRRADGLDQAHVVINFDNGVIGAFSLCMFVPGSREELIVCGDAGRLHASEQALLGEQNQNRVELWTGENGVSRISTPSYPGYIANAGHHGSTFFEHVAFIEELATGEYRGPSLAEAFWSIAVGAAAQRSITERALVDLSDILPVGFDASSFSS